MDLQFNQTYNIALFAVLFAMACGLIQIFLSMLGRRLAVRISLILLFAICAAALGSLLAADVFDGWDAVGIMLIMAYSAFVSVFCTMVSVICFIIKKIRKI